MSDTYYAIPPITSTGIEWLTRQDLRTTVRRLRRWVEILREVERRLESRANTPVFNMLSWFVEVHPPEHRCGTASCAAGYACADRGFRRRGLRNGRAYTECGWGDNVPTYEGAGGAGAIAKFFGIHADEARWVTFPTRYEVHPETPAPVIERIKQLVVRYEGALAAEKAAKKEVT